MNSLIKKILKLPIQQRNEIIIQAGTISKKIAKANIKKIVHKKHGPVAYLVNDDIKSFIRNLKYAMPDLSNLPGDPSHQYDLIIKPLNKCLVNLSR